VAGSPPARELYQDLLDERLARYAVPPTEIPVLPKGQPGAFWTRPERLWILNSDSADILWRELDGLLLGYSPSSDAWLENPAMYRGPELMLGIVSHESEAVLRIWPDEQRLLQEADIPYRLMGKYVDY
jgi:hypothetical protein